MSKFDLTAKIISNVEVANAYFQMALECPEIAAIAKPGQFIHLLIDRRCDPLLRRPFTIYTAKDGNIEILFQVIGRGTRLLSQKYPGEEVTVMGPLGNSFQILDGLKTAILVGGGVGVASLMILAEQLKEMGKRAMILIGAQSSSRILCVDEFREIGAEVSVSTDDGSCGHQGFVTDLLVNILAHPTKYRLHRKDYGSDIISQKFPNCIIYACGPDGMLKTVTKIAAEFRIPAQVTLENRMACGLGACLGCVLKMQTAPDEFEYKRVCVDGPVFDAQQIVWG